FKIQAKADTRTFVRRANQRYRAAHGLNQPLANCQPQAGASAAASVHIFGLDERLEYLPPLIGRHTNPSISYRKNQLHFSASQIAAADRNRDRSLIGELNGIANDI